MSNIHFKYFFRIISINSKYPFTSFTSYLSLILSGLVLLTLLETGGGNVDDLAGIWVVSSSVRLKGKFGWVKRGRCTKILWVVVGDCHFMWLIWFFLWHMNNWSFWGRPPFEKPWIRIFGGERRNRVFFCSRAGSGTENIGATKTFFLDPTALGLFWYCM